MNDESFSDSPHFPGHAGPASDLGSLRKAVLLSGSQEAFLVHVPGISCRFTLDLQTEQFFIKKKKKKAFQRQ